MTSPAELGAASARKDWQAAASKEAKAKIKEAIAFLKNLDADYDPAYVQDIANSVLEHKG